MVMHQAEGMKALCWHVPIQAATVADVESNTSDRNRQFAASMLAQLDDAAEAPTVSDYTTKVQDLKRNLEEVSMHLLHSSLYGALQENVKTPITSACETVASIPSTSTDERTGYNVVDAPPLAWSDVRTVWACSRCHDQTRTGTADQCTKLVLHLLGSHGPC